MTSLVIVVISVISRVIYMISRVIYVISRMISVISPLLYEISRSDGPLGLALAVSPTNTNFWLTFLLTRLQEALYEDLAV